MGVELTQWTLVRPGRLGAPRPQAADTIWLKSPAGEMQLLSLANLSAEVREVVAELASGSKVPKSMLADILAARREDSVVGEGGADRPWTFHHLDRADGLYVYLSPPPERFGRPVAFSLAGLRPQLRGRLGELAAGDPVAEEIVVALQGAAMPGQPVARAAEPDQRGARGQ